MKIKKCLIFKDLFDNMLSCLFIFSAVNLHIKGHLTQLQYSQIHLTQLQITNLNSLNSLYLALWYLTVDGAFKIYVNIAYIQTLFSNQYLSWTYYLAKQLMILCKINLNLVCWKVKWIASEMLLNYVSLGFQITWLLVKKYVIM